MSRAKYGVYIAAPNKKAVRRLDKAILKTLASPAGDEVKKEAIRALATARTPSVTVSNSSISL